MSKRDLLRVALSCAAIVGCIAFNTPVHAATFNVNNGEESSSTSIRNNDLYKTGNTLNIINDITIGNDLPTISNVADLVIQSSEGNKFTVDGNCQGGSGNYNYGYTISNSSVNINNLTFDKLGHYTGDIFSSNEDIYGSVLNINNSNVNLSSVTITNSYLLANTPFTLGTSDPRNAYGGAIYNNGGSLNISGSNISNNSASTDSSFNTDAGAAMGGAIYNSGTLNIDTTTFTNNSASTSGNGGSVGLALNDAI